LPIAAGQAEKGSTTSRAIVQGIHRRVNRRRF
jgi:hypothetical protein